MRFSFTAPPPTDIYTLSLHDALPIWPPRPRRLRTVRNPVPLPTSTHEREVPRESLPRRRVPAGLDRKSTRLNSSHVSISYAVFCLKKKNHHLSLGWTLLELCG